MHEKMRHAWMTEWANLVSRRAWIILVLAAATAGVSVWWTVQKLHFEPDRNALIAESLDFNRRYLDWIAAFPGTNDMYIVVDTHNAAGDPDPAVAQLARSLVDALAAELQTEPAVESVVWGFAPTDVHPKTMRLAPAEQFEVELEQIEQSRLLLESPSMDAFFSKLNRRVYEDMGVQAGGVQRIPDEQMAYFLGLMQAIQTRLSTEADTPVDLLAIAQAGLVEPWEYLATPNGRLLLIRVTPVAEDGALDPFDHAIQRIRAVMEAKRPDFPGVDFGLTGINVIESDETVAVERDSTYASIGAAAAIAVLLVLAFHSIRLPIIMMTALGVAIAWTFGFTTVAVGHLQVISVVFAVILLGLGVAFAIHLASRFERVRHEYPDDAQGMRSALADTFEVMGPGVITGAITTAAAFATTLFTDFRGVAEMGLIASVGVVLCLIAMFTVFAALLRIFKSRHKHTVRLEDRFIHFYEDRWIGPFWRHPWITLLAAAVVFGASMVAIRQMRFDYNLLELLPRGVESVQWQNRIIRDGEQSIYTGVSIADSFEEAARRAQRLRRLDTVDSVGGLGLILQADADERSRRVRKLWDFIERTQPVQLDRQPNPLLSQLAGMQIGINGFLGNAQEPLKSQLMRLNGAIGEVLTASQSLAPDQLAPRLTALQRDFERMQSGLRDQLALVLDDSPITVTDLSPVLIRPYYIQTPEGETKYALEINPRLPEGVNDPLDPAFLGKFVADIEGVDPSATGVIVQVYHSGALILRSYVKAGAIALAIVFVLVWIDFRSIVDAVATLVPVAVGFAATFGVMYLFDRSINPANIIVLPLMFGIGVDDGVHIIHRYRMDRNTRPLGLSGGTGKGISLTSYTTMIGFGAMMFASHRGIAGLGFVLTVGIGMTLLACWTIMPAWLEVRRRRQKDDDDDAAPVW